MDLVVILGLIHLTLIIGDRMLFIVDFLGQDCSYGEIRCITLDHYWQLWIVVNQNRCGRKPSLSNLKAILHSRTNSL